MRQVEIPKTPAPMMRIEFGGVKGFCGSFIMGGSNVVLAGPIPGMA